MRISAYQPFDAMRVRDVFRRYRIPRFEHRLDGRGIDITHQLADELKLPPPPLVRGYALRGEYRVAQRFRQIDLPQPLAV